MSGEWWGGWGGGGGGGCFGVLGGWGGWGGLWVHSQFSQSLISSSPSQSGMSASQLVRNSRRCRQLCSTVFELACGWAPPSLHPLIVTDVMNSPRPSRFLPLLYFLPLFRFHVVLSMQTEEQKSRHWE